MTATHEAIAHTYYDLKEELINLGYADEIDWQQSISTRPLTTSMLLEEAAWVILSSGFKEITIRKVFHNITRCFYYWENITAIINDSRCIDRALSYFNNTRKITAIFQSASILNSIGIKEIKFNLHQQGPTYLKIFPMIGDTTCYHLAKNIGFDTPKPDRHLIKISEYFGYPDTFSFVDTISKITGDPTSEVDIVFWRFATLNRDYLTRLSTIFTEFEFQIEQ